MLRPGRDCRQQPSGIQNEGQLGRYVNESREQWIEKTERGEGDTDAVDHKGSGEIRNDDAMTPPRNSKSFDKL